MNVAHPPPLPLFLSYNHVSCIQIISGDLLISSTFFKLLPISDQASGIPMKQKERHDNVIYHYTEIQLVFSSLDLNIL